MRTPACLSILTLVLSGCIVAGDSEPTRRWDLPAPAEARSTRHAHVFLPSLLRRPTLVTHEQGKPKVHDLDRWGSSLEESIERNLSALLVDAPVEDVVVRIQQLEVSTNGRLRLRFSTEFTLMREGSERVASLTGGGGVTQEGLAPEKASVEQAVSVYAQIPGILGKSILDTVAQAQGGVAKPAPDVTVPGK